MHGAQLLYVSDSNRTTTAVGGGTTVVVVVTIIVAYCSRGAVVTVAVVPCVQCERNDFGSYSHGAECHTTMSASACDVPFAARRSVPTIYETAAIMMYMYMCHCTPRCSIGGRVRPKTVCDDRDCTCDRSASPGLRAFR